MAIPFWDIDELLEAYRSEPEMGRQVERKFETLFRFMQENKLLTRSVLDESGKVVVRVLYTKDLTRAGNDFATQYYGKWLRSKSSADPVKGPELLQKYLAEYRASKRRSG